MNEPWEVRERPFMGDTLWKCVECGRTVWKASEPSAWAHLHHCSHSPHRIDVSDEMLSAGVGKGSGQ